MNERTKNFESYKRMVRPKCNMRGVDLVKWSDMNNVTGR